MGQKTHPYGFRLGIIKTWTSKWYEDKQYAKWLHEDLAIRKLVKDKYAHAGIAGIEIERAANKAKVIISTSRPGIIIGKRGAGVEQLRGELQRVTDNELFVDIQEIRKAETNAQLVAENIATRMPLTPNFIAVETAFFIARAEQYREGRVPLHTLRADIEFGVATAKTTYGTIGVKCWIFKGEILPQRRRPRLGA